MERLTDKNDVGSYFYPKCFEKCDGLGASSKCDNCEIMTSVCEKLGKYEDLEEQGRLVILPCKVGDTLYRLVPNLYREYVEIKIAQFVINKNGIYFMTDKGVSWSADKIGKTVFLTKSEAEAKLKELRGGENEWQTE